MKHILITQAMIDAAKPYRVNHTRTTAKTLLFAHHCPVAQAFDVAMPGNSFHVTRTGALLESYAAIADNGTHKFVFSVDVSHKIAAYDDGQAMTPFEFDCTCFRECCQEVSNV